MESHEQLRLEHEQRKFNRLAQRQRQDDRLTPRLRQALAEVVDHASSVASVVDFSIQFLHDETDRLKPYIVAEYMGHNGPVEKTEKIDRYFSPRIFALGLTQRHDWLHASQQVKQKIWQLVIDGIVHVHPAQYRSSMESEILNM